MITLEQHQQLATLPDYRVFSGGNYEPGELVEVYTDDPLLPIGQFQANFISTGEFV